MQEIGTFDVKISVITKYMAFATSKNLVFIDSMQSMNSSLDALVKNLSDNDVKFLLQKFSGEQLKLIKLKGIYSCENMDRFKTFFRERLCDMCECYSSLKD